MFPLAALADDARISFLEQEVRNLQRQILVLTRRVDEATTRPDRPGSITWSPGNANAAAASTSWIDAAKWQKVRPGMSELEVIGLLGAPTSMREENGARVLRYALEIGSSGFLGGSVTLRERVVSEVRIPELQ